MLTLVLACELYGNELSDPNLIDGWDYGPSSDIWLNNLGPTWGVYNPCQFETSVDMPNLVRAITDPQSSITAASYTLTPDIS